jgi:hypothetical protein
MRTTRLLLLLLLCSLAAGAQKIVYSEPDRDETRRTTFEIIGKVGSNFLVYKNIRSQSFITAYDNDMKQVAKERQDYLPEDRLINVDFFPYTDHAYIIYEYQKKNVVYCEAVKVDGSGKKSGDVRLVDTAHISATTNNKIYTVISSEDKNRLMLFKINSRNKNRYVLSTLLLDRDLTELGRSRHTIPMEERDDHLDEFNVDNDGDFVFSKFSRNNNETITGTWLYMKPAQADTVTAIEVKHEDVLLDEIHVKVDNVNKRYFLTSFYYQAEKRQYRRILFLCVGQAIGLGAAEGCSSSG